MADSAARLVDSVLPDVPFRQWVLTLPYDLRLLAAMRADVLRYIVCACVETIHRWMRRRLQRPGAAAGSVAATHRGGGANIHAGVRVPAGDHVGRERLCRYVTRPPFAVDRFTELPDGRIASRVRHPLGPDKTHRVMTPVELLARLAALVPPPRFPLLRYAGVFAANSPWRSSIVPRPPDTGSACRRGAAPEGTAERAAPPIPGSPQPDAAARPGSVGAAGDPLLAVPTPVPRTLSAEHWKRLDDGRLLARQPRVDWATLLRRTWAQDVLVCPSCAGRMAVLQPVTDPNDIREHLERLGLGAEPATFAPPRDPDEVAVFRPHHPAGPGPPSVARPSGDGSLPSSDHLADPPWQEDCQLPLYDDASQVPPDAQD